MKIVFKRGDPNWKYQRFVREVSVFETLTEGREDHIDIIAKSFLFNIALIDLSNPVFMPGFCQQYGRFPSDNDTIIFYFKGAKPINIKINEVYYEYYGNEAARRKEKTFFFSDLYWELENPAI